MNGKDFILSDLLSWYKDALIPKIELIQNAVEERMLQKETGISGSAGDEIYLSDARRVSPEKLKTVIRHPIKKA